MHGRPRPRSSRGRHAADLAASKRMAEGGPDPPRRGAGSAAPLPAVKATAEMRRQQGECQQQGGAGLRDLELDQARGGLGEGHLEAVAGLERAAQGAGGRRRRSASSPRRPPSGAPRRRSGSRSRSSRGSGGSPGRSRCSGRGSTWYPRRPEPVRCRALPPAQHPRSWQTDSQRAQRRGGSVARWSSALRFGRKRSMGRAGAVQEASRVRKSAIRQTKLPYGSRAHPWRGGGSSSPRKRSSSPSPLARPTPRSPPPRAPRRGARARTPSPPGSATPR